MPGAEGAADEPSSCLMRGVGFAEAGIGVEGTEVANVTDGCVADGVLAITCDCVGSGVAGFCFGDHGCHHPNARTIHSSIRAANHCHREDVRISGAMKLGSNDIGWEAGVPDGAIGRTVVWRV